MVSDDKQNLAAFQRQFLQRLYHQQNRDAELSARDRLGVETYRGSLYGGLNRALQAIYPVCAEYVGERFFSAMADRYIARFPSTVDRLDDYGEQFAEFIACFEPVQTLPQLPALARLEWAWHRAFHSADVAGFDFNAFGEACQRHSSAIHFQLAPELTLLSEEYAIDLLWQWHQGDRSQPQPELDCQPQPLVVFRPGTEVHIERLALASWQLLQQLQRDSSLDALCACMGEALGVQLPLAIERGWIRRFYLCMEAENDDEAGR